MDGLTYVNSTGLAIGNERYVVVWRDGQKAAALRVIGEWAENPDLSFTWYHAAVLSQRIRREAAMQEKAEKRFTLT